MSERVECQVVGCTEPATNYGVEIDMAGIEVELRLCRRHESSLYGGARPPERPVEVERQA